MTAGGETRPGEKRGDMPGIIDSHVHVTLGVGFDYIDPGVDIPCSGKKEILDFMAEHVRTNPGAKCYHFGLEYNKS